MKNKSMFWKIIFEAINLLQKENPPQKADLNEKNLKNY